MTPTNFPQWLQSELQRRGWTQSDLAKRAGISRAGITHVLNQTRAPGPDFCRAIARALNIPPETVFRKAGLLPPRPDADPEIEEALYLLAQLPAPVRKLILRQIRAAVEMETEPPTSVTHKRGSEAAAR